MCDGKIDYKFMAKQKLKGFFGDQKRPETKPVQKFKQNVRPRRRGQFCVLVLAAGFQIRRGDSAGRARATAIGGEFAFGQ